MGRPKEFEEDDALFAAIDVFWERGYNNTSMQELCTAMGVSSGSLYFTFGDKENLFYAALNKYLQWVTQEGIEKVRVNSSGLAGIHDYFDYVVDGILNGKRCNGCFGTNTFIELGNKDEKFRKLMSKHFKMLEMEFRNALKRDNIHNAKENARYLVCFAQGLNVLARTSPGQTYLSDLVSTTLKPLHNQSA